MSKAFTRESDDAPEEPLPIRPAATLPPGAKNYLTPDGAQRLRGELTRLVEVERPKVAGIAGDPEAMRRLQGMDQRILSLQRSLESAVVTGPPPASEESVRFGASVTVRDRAGAEAIYRIVGVDETDLDRNWVSWLSPIARALLNARRGQRVKFKLPGGDEELEIVAVTYELA